jgi:hypothetical protein
MPDPDYKALCAALIDKIDYTWDDIPTHVWDLILRVRDELAQPEPVAPTDEELWEAYDQMDGVPEDWPWCRDYARAVLARWGTPANNTGGTHTND